MQGLRAPWSLASSPLRVSRAVALSLQGSKGPFTGRIYDYPRVSYTAGSLGLLMLHPLNTIPQSVVTANHKIILVASS